MNVDEVVEAGTRLILRIVFLVLALWILYLVRDVILIIFAAILMSAAVVPVINYVKNFGLSRRNSVLIVYLGLFLIGGGLIATLVPLFLSELKDFGEHFPQYSERLNQSLSGWEEYLHAFGITFDREAFFVNLERSITSGFQSIFSTTVSIFSSLVSILGFFFLALYLSLEENGIEKLFRLLTPKPYQAYMLSIAERIQTRTSQWLVGQLIVMGIIFSVYYIGFSLLGLPYALALALLGGLLEIIPYVGPVVAAVPSVLLGFLTSPILGISILLFCVVVHQIESQLVTPQIMKRSVGLSPAVVIVAILTGASLGGPVGILLSIPTAMILSVFVEDFLVKKENAAKEGVLETTNTNSK